MAILSFTGKQLTVTSINEMTECQKCGRTCQVQTLRWNNEFGIQHFKRPDWRCNHCGHQCEDSHDSYEGIFEEAIRHPNECWSADLEAEKKKIVDGLSPEKALELSRHLEDLWKATVYRWVDAIGTSGSASEAIQAAADGDKDQAFVDGFSRLCNDLVAVQQFLIDELREMLGAYEIPESQRPDWPSKVLEVIWRPLESTYFRWIIGTLKLSTDAAPWIAPTWLWNVLNISILETRCAKMGEWGATQQLLGAICRAARGELLYEREKALTSARLKIRSKSHGRDSRLEGVVSEPGDSPRSQASGARESSQAARVEKALENRPELTTDPTAGRDLILQLGDFKAVDNLFRREYISNEGRPETQFSVVCDYKTHRPECAEQSVWLSTAEYATRRALPEAEARSSSPAARKGRPRDRRTQTRQRTIRQVASRGVTGEAYCRALDAEGLETPHRWQDDGCPKKYPTAYQHPDLKQRAKWRARIHDEKYKTTRKPAQNGAD